jgi:hypothetical protein
VDSISGERLKKLHPVCTSVGFDFQYYVKEENKGEGSPYKNMKQLVEATIKTQKKVFEF